MWVQVMKKVLDIVPGCSILGTVLLSGRDGFLLTGWAVHPEADCDTPSLDFTPTIRRAAICGTTHICSLPSGSGWFRGLLERVLLSPEKQRPRKETLPVMSQDKPEQASKTGHRAGGRSSMAHAPRSTWIDRRLSTDRTPSRLRECWNRWSIKSNPLESKGNVPVC